MKAQDFSPCLHGGGSLTSLFVAKETILVSILESPTDHVTPPDLSQFTNFSFTVGENFGSKMSVSTQHPKKAVVAKGRVGGSLTSPNAIRLVVKSKGEDLGGSENGENKRLVFENITNVLGLVEVVE